MENKEMNTIEYMNVVIEKFYKAADEFIDNYKDKKEE